MQFSSTLIVVMAIVLSLNLDLWRRERERTHFSRLIRMGLVQV